MTDSNVTPAYDSFIYLRYVVHCMLWSRWLLTGCYAKSSHFVHFHQPDRFSHNPGLSIRSFRHVQQLPEKGTITEWPVTLSITWRLVFIFNHHRLLKQLIFLFSPEGCEHCPQLLILFLCSTGIFQSEYKKKIAE